MTARAVAAAFLLALVTAPAVAGAQTFDCLIHPETTVAVSAPVEGLLEKVHVDRGDLVVAGQVLATLESSVEKATLVAARARTQLEAPIKTSEARVAFGDRRYVRTLELFRKEIVSIKEMDEAETAKVLADLDLLQSRENQRLAEIELDRATAALALRTVRSPINGVVVERLLSAGEFAKQAPIVRLAQIDPLRVEVIVPATLFGRVSPGTVADVTPEPALSEPRSARVTVVDRVIDAASGTFGVRLALPNPGYRLPAGLKCRVRFNGRR
jgi:RND family efflux transporter MFP subunit